MLRSSSTSAIEAVIGSQAPCYQCHGLGQMAAMLNHCCKPWRFDATGAQGYAQGCEYVCGCDILSSRASGDGIVTSRTPAFGLAKQGIATDAEIHWNLLGDSIKCRSRIRIHNPAHIPGRRLRQTAMVYSNG